MKETTRRSIGQSAAIHLAESGWWMHHDARTICCFQLFTKELCMDFGDFHKALEEALGRPVWTHELALNYDGLVAEFLGQRSAPSLGEILDLIPEAKRVVAFIGDHVRAVVQPVTPYMPTTPLVIITNTSGGEA